jgi:hypothetical protein
MTQSDLLAFIDTADSLLADKWALEAYRDFSRQRRTACVLLYADATWGVVLRSEVHASMLPVNTTHGTIMAGWDRNGTGIAVQLPRCEGRCPDFQTELTRGLFAVRQATSTLVSQRQHRERA